METFFDLRVDFNVFVANFTAHGCKFLHHKKRVLPVAPLFDLGVDFGVFYYLKYKFLGS